MPRAKEQTYGYGIYVDDRGNPWAIRSTQSTILINRQAPTNSPTWSLFPREATPRAVIAQSADGSKIKIIAMNNNTFPWVGLGSTFSWIQKTYLIVDLIPENIPTYIPRMTVTIR